ncbi:hypothetical protein NX801_29945 [Streptomyces sp. LP05-1]|uniref:Uncharacterized protein n=1 Tax=Streptomyces pyxinae TaxID=2970734 RepID=A0ABT2CR97_9ACTN|nr:hypothetical protein [Streptomyces sp. LP05-1]MCS0639786.1 hypothetical protein [Streptomyces sp. LP05-1]
MNAVFVGPVRQDGGDNTGERGAGQGLEVARPHPLPAGDRVAGDDGGRVPERGTDGKAPQVAGGGVVGGVPVAHQLQGKAFVHLPGAGVRVGHSARAPTSSATTARPASVSHGADAVVPHQAGISVDAVPPDETGRSARSGLPPAR